MALGVNEFVSEALKNGYKIEDVVGFMNENDNPEYKDWANKWNTKGFGAESKGDEFQQKAGAMESEYQQQKKDATTTNVFGFELPSVFTGTGGLLGMGAAAGAAALAGGEAIVGGLKNRSIKNPQVAEVVGDLAKAEVAPTDYTVPAYQRKAAIIDTAGAPVAQPTQMTPEQILKQRSEQIRAAGIQPPTAPQAPAPQAAAPQVPSAPQAGAVPPVQQGPVTVTEAVVTGQNPVQAIQKDLAQQIDTAPTQPIAPPSEAGVKTRAAKTTVNFKPGQALPEGTTFRPDIGNLDRSLYNILGPEHRRNAMEMLNNGKPFGDVADVNAAVKDISAKYWSELQGQIPETILSREARAAQGVKSEFGNFGKLGKGVKVAGVAGTLLTLADLANAAQQAKEGNYAEAAKTAAPALDPTGLAFAAVNPNEASGMLKNVSPMAGMLSQLFMAGSDKAEKEAYKKKVGSGRGIAPPSAYQR